jgi:hypothetical protein
MPQTDVAWAVKELGGSNKRIQAYKSYQKYYDGDHPLAFATRKFRSTFWGIFAKFSDNLCQSVVDVQAERLEVVGFTSNSATTETDEATGVHLVRDKVGDAAWELWEEYDLDLVADEVHKDALLFGDGFTITESDGSIWCQEPPQMAVRYSEEKPGTIELAAKTWRDAATDHVNLNLYYPDHVERYTTRAPQKGATLNASAFESAGEDVATDSMAVAHFPNRAYSRYGISELKPVLPLQDALNKSVIDMLVASEYQAFRQRWITGVEPDLDADGRPQGFNASHGPGEFLTLPGENAKVGDFAQTDMTPFHDLVDSFRAECARVSGIPPYYFFADGGGGTPSGESLKTMEVRFTRKGQRQQRCFGKGWENATVAALVATDEVDSSDGLDLNAVWDGANARSESEKMDVLVKKQAIGVPNSQLQKEAGYDPDQVKQFATEKPPDVHAKTTIDDAAVGAEDAPPGPAAPVSSVPQHDGAEPVDLPK